VRAIPIERLQQERYHAGDDIRLIWGKYLNKKGNVHTKKVSGFLNPDGSDTFTVIIRYDLGDIFFNDHIRIYWNFPNGD
jgi:hypothetical protein